MSNSETAASTGQETGRPAPEETHPAPSPRRRVVLALTVTAFLLWIGYLAFLAASTIHPVVLSRPQLLVSNLIVIAQLTGAEHPDATASVEQVVWSGEPAALAKAKASIKIENLERVSKERGWEGPGEYILALTQLRDGTLRVTPIPPSPGYPANKEQQANRVRIYLATPSARQQLADVEQQYHRQ